MAIQREIGTSLVDSVYNPLKTEMVMYYNYKTACTRYHGYMYLLITIFYQIFISSFGNTCFEWFFGGFFREVFIKGFCNILFGVECPTWLGFFWGVFFLVFCTDGEMFNFTFKILIFQTFKPLFHLKIY